MCKPKALTLKGTTYASEDGWLIVIDTDNGPDPKIHFTEKDKAYAMYDALAAAISSDAKYLRFDVLEHGAI